MPDYELIIPLIVIIAMGALLIYFLIIFSQKVEDGTTVRVKDDGNICNPPLGDLPIIGNSFCDDELGNNVRCYQPDGDMDLVFEISQVPYYYASVCSRICDGININGGCDDESEIYKSCISLLEPPGVCNTSANPLGRLTETNDVYYAKKVI
jgi:hypothetical protein